MSDHKYRCVIIDDEKLAQELIEQHINKLSDFEVVESFYSAIEAAPFISKNKIDLIFLDIQMPDLDGLSFLKTHKKLPPAILTTAYSEFALESYELNVIDYLLKPITFERFMTAISKTRSLFSNPESEEQNVLEDSIFVKSDHKLIKINFSDILFIEGMQKYVKFHLVEKMVVTLMSLTKLEEILPTKSFYRVQKSFIINLSKIDAIYGNKAIIGENEVPISKTLKADLIKKLDKYKLL